MKIALCQLNTISGNIAYNCRRITEELEVASSLGARLAVFPELTLMGYPPKDMLEYDGFIVEAAAALEQIKDVCSKQRIDALVGTAHPNVYRGKKGLLNAAAMVTAGGDIRFTFKKLLPTYDVFDEDRYFQPIPAETIPPIIEYRNTNTGKSFRVGTSICEDIYNDNQFWENDRLYESDPIQILAKAGADLIINISASPFVAEKPPRRINMLRHTAQRWNKPVVFVNQVGGCDQVIFDGGSCVVLPEGTVPCCAGWFRDKTVIWDMSDLQEQAGLDAMIKDAADPVRGVADALKLGLTDYLRKTGFSQVVVGNSGGIDSAVVLALATDALGPQNVLSISMPGPFTTEATREDSIELARKLSIRHTEVPIGDTFDAFAHQLRDLHSPVLKALFNNDADGVSAIADENLQARIRAIMLMWISNAIDNPRTLVLSTGNKSELAVGYCTLYGDMAGGLAPVSDVPKMLIYKLADYLNLKMGDVIPHSIIEREPTAELAPNQKDSDSLPPYRVLDEIIRLHVEEMKTSEQIVQLGVAAEETVRRIVCMVSKSEYKRAQAAPGLKVTTKAFGAGRRMPIARG